MTMVIYKVRVLYYMKVYNFTKILIIFAMSIIYCKTFNCYKLILN